MISQDKELVSETLEMLQGCYQRSGKNGKWAEFLHRIVEENIGTATELILADILEARERTDIAQAYITR